MQLKFQYNFYSSIIKLLLSIILIISINGLSKVGGDSTRIYIGYFSLLFVFLLYYFLKKHKRVAIRKFDLLFLLMLFAWGYGIIVGLLNNNSTSLIFRNFFGMTVYSFYFILYKSQLNKEQVYSIILNFCHIVTLVILIFSIFILDHANIGLIRLVYSSLQFYVFALIPIYIVSIKQKDEIKLVGSLIIKNTFGKTLALLIFIIISVFLSLSKGMLLALLIVFGIIFIFTIPLKKKILIGASIFTLLFFFYSLYVSTPLFELLKSIFSAVDPSNESRYLQIKYLFEDSTFFGKGLGAGLSNGFNRDNILVYAFEVNYHNIIHKFGIISLLIFFTYCVVLYKILLNFSQRNEIKFTAMALGCVAAFLCMGIGNPVLFAPESVILHCFAIYLLR